MQGADLIHDELGFIVCGVPGEAHNEFTVSHITPEFLVLAVKVVRDHRVSSRKNGLRGAVVLLQHHHVCAREVTLELGNVAHVCATEGIDGLVGVTDHGQ